MKAKNCEFDSKIKTMFSGNGVRKENILYTCIACITINSVMRILKKNLPQVYLEECKYRAKSADVQIYKYLFNRFRVRFRDRFKI